VPKDAADDASLGQALPPEDVDLTGEPDDTMPQQAEGEDTMSQGAGETMPEAAGDSVNEGAGETTPQEEQEAHAASTTIDPAQLTAMTQDFCLQICIQTCAPPT
jgi:hypothetical protein